MVIFHNIIQHLNIFNSYWWSSWWFQACFLFNHILDDEWPLCILVFFRRAEAPRSCKKSCVRRMIFPAWRPFPNGFSCKKLLQTMDSWELRHLRPKSSRFLSNFSCVCPAILAQTTSSWVKPWKSRWLLHLLIGRTQHDNNLYKWYIYIYNDIYISISLYIYIYIYNLGWNEWISPFLAKIPRGTRYVLGFLDMGHVSVPGFYWEWWFAAPSRDLQLFE